MRTLRRWDLIAAQAALVAPPQRPPHQTAEEQQSPEAEEPGIPVVEIGRPGEGSTRAHQTQQRKHCGTNAAQHSGDT